VLCPAWAATCRRWLVALNVTAAGWLAAAARGGWHRIASHVLAGWRRRRAAAASHGIDP